MDHSVPQAEGGLWKYVVIGLVLVVGSFGYLEWVSRTPPTVVSQPAPHSPAAASAPPPEALPSEPSAPIQEQAIITPAPSQRPPTTESENTAPAPATATEAEPESAQATEDSPSSSEELRVAEHYLSGPRGSRDTTEAAKWLWKAVGKQNTQATLLLADLYARGDGVPKSCDQARLLLIAARKKGFVEAASRLRSLERTGCSP